jgi:hypothetical protein
MKTGQKLILEMLSDCATFTTQEGEQISLLLRLATS